MEKPQTKGVLLSIIQDLVLVCQHRQRTVTEPLVAALMKGILLNTKHNFPRDAQLQGKDVDRLKELCLEVLLSDDLSLETMKMQVYFDMSFTQQEMFLMEYHQVFNEKMRDLQREINGSQARQKEELDTLYRNMVSYVVLNTQMGSPSDRVVIRETRVALQSVLPRSQLTVFLSSSGEVKRERLRNLCHIVAGIRLFNKECGKGGHGIEELPAILAESVPLTLKSLDASLKQVNREANQLAVLCESAGGSARLLAAQFSARQEEQFLKKIMLEGVACARRVEAYMESMEEQAAALNSQILQRAAVPTSQIYPWFTTLHKIWRGFQEEVVWLDALNKNVEEMAKLSEKRRQLYPRQWLMRKLGGREVVSDGQRSEKMAGQKLVLQLEGSSLDKVKVIDEAELTADQAKTEENFAFKGFCCWSLVTLHQLLPGVLSLGVIVYQDKYYIFSCKEGATDFADNPENYIDKTHGLATEFMEVSALLGLDKDEEELGRRLPTTLPQEKCDAEVQTPVHFLDSHIDKQYTWNEWDLRRNALKMASLRHKVTKSSQTNSSSLRNDSSTQAAQTRSRLTQTKCDEWSNTPQPSRYIQGLRGIPRSSSLGPNGGRKTQATIIDLTLPVIPR